MLNWNTYYKSTVPLIQMLYLEFPSFRWYIIQIVQDTIAFIFMLFLFTADRNDLKFHGEEEEKYPIEPPKNRVWKW